MGDIIAPFLGLFGTLLGGYLVLRGQEADRAFKAVRDDRQLIRDRAQQVLAEITTIRARSMPALIALVQHFAEKDRSKRPDLQTFPNVSELKSLLAVYFPSLLPTIIDYELRREAAAKDFKIETGAEIPAMEKRVISIAMTSNELLTEALKDVENKLLELLASIPLVQSKPSIPLEKWSPRSWFKPTPPRFPDRP